MREPAPSRQAAHITPALACLVVVLSLALLACGGSEAPPTDLPIRTTPVASHSFPPQEPYTGSNYARGTNGIEFVPEVDIEITDLGYYDDGGDGLLNEHTVGIFATSSEELVTEAVTVDGESTLQDGFRYEPITPVVLKRGESYVLAGGTGAPYDLIVADPDGVVWAPEVRFVDLRWLNVPGKEFLYPSRMEGHFLGDFFGVLNFRFRTPASPASSATP